MEKCNPKDSGIICMPLRTNIPHPKNGWKLTTCPICGNACWQTDLARQVMAANPGSRTACTVCALKADHKK